MRIELHAATDIGRIRQGNEDNFLVLNLAGARSWTGSDKQAEPPAELDAFDLGPEGAVLVVSDGMGGALAGDVASRMAVEETVRLLTADDAVEADSATTADPHTPATDTPLVEWLLNAAIYANLAIHNKSVEDPRCSGMGATLTAAAISDHTVDFVQVGDSRGYVLRGSEIKLATKDQSLVQQLVDVGQISEADAETHMFRNVILQALGAQGELTPVVSRVRVHQGDMVLLCSDGLSGKLRAEEMRELVAGSNGDLAAACRALVDEANRRGGEDNITVILARFSGADLPAEAEPIAIEQPFPERYARADDDDTTPIP